ncbi:m070R [Myxoma virus]|uniref:M070R n=37 Tax=Myxoma virus TaxID=10273 RepID=Q9Q8N0_MYXVL|nr:putative viral membrane protein [Myxoma virus]ACB28865.1 m070R [recombinant virus 6918VP60-T2]AAF14958.1 m070R [Myxoma virus]ACB28693.1 m070R [Myxoma virus]ADK63710.1 m70R [Myxoma virus]AFU77002.1 m070R [Myxoma virus]
MDKTTLTVNGVELEYIREKETEGIRGAKVSTVCFFVLILAVSALLLWFQASDNSIFSELLKYSRIKNAVKGWRPLVESKTKLEADKGRLRAAGNDKYFSFSCVDFGSYLMPIKLDTVTFLPQAIRRGTGDGWMVKKADKVDPSAQQFCEYLIRNNSDNVITCGTKMMDQLGYSGYFIRDHWCSNYHNLTN